MISTYPEFIEVNNFKGLSVSEQIDFRDDMAIVLFKQINLPHH